MNDWKINQASVLSANTHLIRPFKVQREWEYFETLVLIDETVIVKEMDRLYNSIKLECCGIFSGSSQSAETEKKIYFFELGEFLMEIKDTGHCRKTDL